MILKVHVRKMPLAADVSLKEIARGTPGFSGADLMNVANEAALLAARRNRRTVSQKEFEEAKDKVMLGAERRYTAATQEEKDIVRYHESGHAIVALHVKSADPIYKGTMIPRGRALGMIVQLPETDRRMHTREWIVSRLAILMGGRVAEELKFGKDKVTTGAGGDIQQATKLARAMVMEWGFSDKLGNVAYGDSDGRVSQGVSGLSVQMIDQEVRRIIDEAYAEAIDIMLHHEGELETLAAGLLEFETLSGAEITDLVLHGKRPVRVEAAEPDQSDLQPEEPVVKPESKPFPKRPGFFGWFGRLAFGNGAVDTFLLAYRAQPYLQEIAEFLQKDEADEPGDDLRETEIERAGQLLSGAFDWSGPKQKTGELVTALRSVMDNILASDHGAATKLALAKGAQVQALTDLLAAKGGKLAQVEARLKNYEGVGDVEEEQSPIEVLRRKAGAIGIELTEIMQTTERMDAGFLPPADMAEMRATMFAVHKELDDIASGRKLPPSPENWEEYLAGVRSKLEGALSRYEAAVNAPGRARGLFQIIKRSQQRYQIKRLRQRLLGKTTSPYNNG
jgi:hypothetical protein